MKSQINQSALVVVAEQIKGSVLGNWGKVVAAAKAGSRNSEKNWIFVGMVSKLSSVVVAEQDGIKVVVETHSMLRPGQISVFALVRATGRAVKLSVSGNEISHC